MLLIDLRSCEVQLRGEGRMVKIAPSFLVELIDSVEMIEMDPPCAVAMLFATQRPDFAFVIWRFH